MLNDVESFQQYMAEEGKRWSGKRWGENVVMTTPIYTGTEALDPEPSDEDSWYYEIETLYDGAGNLVCEYISYFDFVHHMEFSGDDLFPITVYTAEHQRIGATIQGTLVEACIVLMILDGIIACIYYTFRVAKNKKAIVK